jgi:cell division protein FtsB
VERKKVVIQAAVSAAIIAILFLPGFSKLQRLQEENEQLRQRIKLLGEYNDVLREEITKMEEDPSYLEKRAREKLGIVKKGEYIYKGSGN